LEKRYTNEKQEQEGVALIMSAKAILNKKL
jgi:hypothetical protein